MEPLTLEVVLKVTERCNIDCSYCYMFNKGNEDFRSHPPLVPQSTVDSLQKFIRQAVDEYGLKRVTLILHGGEPLLMKKERFERLCRDLIASVPSTCETAIGIQTNATLLDEGWIRLLSRLKVAVGVSLDGPREFNDKHRVDHKGRGTYDATVAGLRLVQEAHRAGLLPPPGVICVINPEYSGKETYRHFIDDLQLGHVSFLLPMESHDSMTPALRQKVGEFLVDVTREWIADDNPYISVRILNNFLRFLTAPADGPARDRVAEKGRALIVSVASDGTLSADDELKPISYGVNLGNVSSMSLREFLAHPEVVHHRELQKKVPSACGNCEWVGYCQGGMQNQVSINRYSRDNAFGNPSILCDSLKTFYSEATAFVLKEGKSVEEVTTVLEKAAEAVEVADQEWFTARFAAATSNKRKVWLASVLQ